MCSNLTKGDAQHISSAEVDSSVAAAGATLIHFTSSEPNWQALYTCAHSVRCQCHDPFHGVLDVIHRHMRHRRRWYRVQDTRNQYQGRIKVASFQRHRCWSSVLRLFQWSACVSAPCAKTPSGWHPFGSAPRVTIIRRALIWTCVRRPWGL